MSSRLNILMVSAECAPFAKTGGLGDVVGALPYYLRKAGHRVIVVTPLYSLINRKHNHIVPAIDKVDVPFGNGVISCSVYTTNLQAKVPVYFLEHHQFFSREGIYHDSGFNDYSDNPVRFAFLSKAALQLCYHLNFKPDIVHAHDWHTAVISAFLKRMFKDEPLFSDAAGVLTIHNIAYQGRYNREAYFSTGLGWEDFTQDKFEYYGDVNFLKGGIHFSDTVNTVSPGYAAETRTFPGGSGLEYFLNLKGEDYTGILNGADYNHWNPETDKLIPANYSVDDLSGKAICKNTLRKQLGLKQNSEPVIGIVSRFVEQKGLHLVAGCLDELMKKVNFQIVVLGAGDKMLENYFRTLPQRYPGRAGSYIGYDNELAHLIEAGSDFFLMPSIYEPCGLNQIYSLKYGTLPIVRATGGLNDTVMNYDPETGDGTGFKFLEPACSEVYNTLKRAVDTYFQRKHHIKKMITTAMRQHFTWEESTKEYIRLYKRALKKVRTLAGVM